MPLVFACIRAQKCVSEDSVDPGLFLDAIAHAQCELCHSEHESAHHMGHACTHLTGTTVHLTGTTVDPICAGRPFDSPNLLGYWTFEDGPSSSTIHDLSGHDRDAQIEGSPTWVESPIAHGNHALHFNGGSDIARAMAAGLPATGPRTLMFWFKGADDIMTDGDWRWLVGYGARSGRCWKVNVRDNPRRLVLDFWGHTEFDSRLCGDAQSNGAFACNVDTNGWHHVALSYDGAQNSNSLKGYYDGQKTHEGRPDMVANTDLSFHNGMSFTFAGYPEHDAQNTRVTLDDVAILDVVLSDEEILAVYTSCGEH
eukprot:SAG31_NODE_602_length_13638_cov_32.936037_18_plen_311_part_00